MAWCERNRVHYVLGRAGNSRLLEELAIDLAWAEDEYRQTSAPLQGLSLPHPEHLQPVAIHFAAPKEIFRSFANSQPRGQAMHVEGILARLLL